MSAFKPQLEQVHRDPELFREAINFTAAQTGFAQLLIEKDYYCTLLLSHLAPVSEEIVFKGGTCLAKVHSEFYRMSEDLDFSIPIAESATRGQRRRRADGLKKVIDSLYVSMPFFFVVEPLIGANNSTQYTGAIGYRSLLLESNETVRVEVSLREPLLMPSIPGPVRTLLLDPVSSEPLISPLEFSCISWIEAIAEKFRAAMTRLEVAVRDFFDLDYAVRRLGLNLDSAELTRLVQRKLQVSGNAPINLSEARLVSLRSQLDPQLRSVLRPGDFAEFDVNRAFKIVIEMAKRYSSP